MSRATVNPERVGGSRQAVVWQVVVWQSLAVAGLALVATFVLVHPWPLDVPLSWGGDAFQHAALVDSANWLGTPGVDNGAGAPHGVDWSSLPTGGERLHLVVLAALAGVTGDVFVAGNLHLMLVIAATAVTGFLVLRWMGSSGLLAGAGGLVFALSPAVYGHLLDGHQFLFGLYPIPLAVFLACRCSGWVLPRPSLPEVEDVPAGRRDWRRLVPSGVAVVVIGLSSTYYSVFAVLLIGLLGVLVAVRRMDWRAAVPTTTAAAGVVLVSLLSGLGDLFGDSPAAELDRRLSDSKRFALDPIRMLFPQQDHPLGFLAGWGAPPVLALGTAATVGLVVLGFVVLRRVGRPRDPADRLLSRLAALAAIATATGVSGGIGWLIAMVGLEELRVWSRISTTIAFLGIAALVLVATRAIESPILLADGEEGAPTLPRTGLLIPVVALVLLALLGQRAGLAAHGSVSAEMAEDRDLVTQMEAELPSGSMVLEWPSVAFADDFGSERLLAPGLLSDELRFSAGAFRGGPGDWQQSWSLENRRDQLTAAAAAGFRALLVQLDHHLWADPDGVSAELRGLLGPPAGVSSAGTWEWYDLSPLAGELEQQHGRSALGDLGQAVVRPVGVSFEGTPGFPSTGRERDVVMGVEGGIVMRSHDGQDREVVVVFDLSAAPGVEVALTSGEDVTTVAPGPGGRQVVHTVHMSGGRGELHLSIDGAPLRTLEGEPDVAAELRDVAVFDAALAESEVLRPSRLR